MLQDAGSWPAETIAEVAAVTVLTLSTAIGGDIVVAATLYTARHNARHVPRAGLASIPAAP